MCECPSEDQLRSYLAEELSEQDRTAVESHVESCEACQAGLASLTENSVGARLRPRGTTPGDDADTVPLGSRPSIGSSDTFLAQQPKAPGYEILEELGRGGMGVVYRARDARLNRVVALKMLRDSMYASNEMRIRFRIEGEAVARLQHPGIVQVFECGEADGWPFLAMEYVDGKTLADRLKDDARIAPRQAAVLLANLADAVAAAHASGVIHRDLKPSNILLSGASAPEEGAVVGGAEGGTSATKGDRPLPVPKVTDFGLAKLDGTDLTRTGALMGTPAYMAPEQAGGRTKEIGTATDVYALGAILYETLTGRPPFEAATALDILYQVIHHEPTRIRSLARDVPPDLETICHKCLEKDPKQRYRTADALASDLRAFLDNRLIGARPAGPIERARKWARRHPAATALIAMALAALAINDAMLRAEKDRTDIQRQRAQDNFEKADEQRRRAEELSANLTIDRGLSFCERGEVNRGLLWLARALEVAPSGDDTIQAAARASLGSWSRRLTSLRSILRHPNELVMGATFLPGESSILTISKAPSASYRLEFDRWDLGSGLPAAKTWQAGDPQGWLTGGGGPPGWSIDYYREPVIRLLSPDQTAVLVDDPESGAHLVSVATGRPIGRPIPHAQPLMCAAFSPDGTRIVLGGQDRTARAYRVATGEPIGGPMSHEGWVTDAAFDPEGKVILTGSRDGTARLWDAGDGRPLFPPLRHERAVLRVAYSPDGRTVLTGGFDGTARLWDPLTGRALGRTLQHSATVIALAYAPDSRTIATGSEDGTGRIWDASTGEPIGTPLRHESVIGFVTFSPDGRTVATCGDDNSVRLWDASTGSPQGSPLEHVGMVEQAAFAPDGRVLVTSGRDFEAQVWDTATSLSPGIVYQEAQPVSRTAYSPDGRTIAVACTGSTVRIRDAATGLAIGETIRLEGELRVVAYSPDGRLLLTAGTDRTARLWDTLSGAMVGEPMAHPVAIRSAAFHPDGSTFATGDYHGAVRFWDVATCKATGPTLAQAEGDRIETVSFSPDGRVILSGSDDNTGRLWDVRSGRPIGQPLRHQGSFRSSCFRHDGKVVATGGWDKAVRFWDAATGEPAGPPLLLQSLISSMDYSPDDRSLIIGFTDQTARIWDPAGAKPISPPLVHKGRVSSVAFRFDGRAALTGSADGTARIWNVVGPVQGSVERIRCWVEVLTRMELSPEGAVHVLKAGEWDERRLRLRELGGPPEF
ncbi:MAG: protein kinase [Isosphaeraceae bacterium]